MSDCSAASLPRVVVVEDNPGDVRLVEDGVAAAAELDLQIIKSGRAAIERLTSLDGGDQREHPDLILLDLNLPGRSGFDVLRAVRTETDFRDVPVVVVSSSRNRDDIARVYELSGNAYVTKPSDPDDYIEMIAAVVDFWVESANRSTPHG
ncbi:response regulator [Halorubrum ezzemoulense]|uniref:response regulator n=1 Tax=Halorubrum ezzemoulense TaxID=337243 RepID=UPI00232B139B|nr:response regulator [Halorubrum ezzemoulense]MDB2265055.1 response regulator [Halorubrum ezzemoulense]